MKLWKMKDILSPVRDVFCVFFPSDIHRPQVISGEAMNLRKVVVKVSVALL